VSHRARLLARAVFAALLAAAAGCSHPPPPHPPVAEVPIRTPEEASAPPPAATPVHADKFACANPKDDPMTCTRAHPASTAPPRSGVFIGRGARGRGLRN